MESSFLKAVQSVAFPIWAGGRRLAAVRTAGILMAITLGCACPAAYGAKALRLDSKTATMTIANTALFQSMNGEMQLSGRLILPPTGAALGNILALADGDPRKWPFGISLRNYAGNDPGIYQLCFSQTADPMEDSNTACVRLDTMGDANTPRDITFRFRRDLDIKRWTVEVWKTDGGERFLGSCFWATVNQTPGCAITPPNPTANLQIAGAQVVFGNNSIPMVRFAWLKWKTGVDRLTSRMPIETDPADLLDIRFEHNDGTKPTDAHGHANFSISSPAYVTTASYKPIVAVRQAYADAKEELLGECRALRAGRANTLESVAFSPSGDAITAYQWQTTVFPAGALPRMENPTGANLTVIPPVFGEYTYQVTVTDSNGLSSMASLTCGAVAVDEKDVVVYPSEEFNDLLGPALRFGRSPWPYIDERHRSLSNFFGNLLMNDPGWQPTWYTLDSAGTISFNPAGLNVLVTGTGTNFFAEFGISGRCNSTNGDDAYTCASTVGEVVRNDGAWIILNVQTANTGAATLDIGDGAGPKPIKKADGPDPADGAVRVLSTYVRDNLLKWDAASDSWRIQEPYHFGFNYRYQRPAALVAQGAEAEAYSEQGVQTILSATELKIQGYFDPEEDVLPVQSNIPWRAFGGNSNKGSSNEGYYAGFDFYDNALAHYAMYYRTGLTKYRDYARTMKQRRWDSPSMNRGKSRYRFDLYNSDTSLYLYALEANKTELWWGLRKMAAMMMDNITTTAPVVDARFEGYRLWRTALAAKYDPMAGSAECTANNYATFGRACWKQKVTQSLANKWVGQQRGPGCVAEGWDGVTTHSCNGYWGATTDFWGPGPNHPVVEIAADRRTVTWISGDKFPANGCVSPAGMFDRHSFAYFTPNPPGNPHAAPYQEPWNLNWDKQAYQCTRNSDTQITLARDYVGPVGQKKLRLDPLSGQYGIQPFLHALANNLLARTMDFVNWGDAAERADRTLRAQQLLMSLVAPSGEFKGAFPYHALWATCVPLVPYCWTIGEIGPQGMRDVRAEEMASIAQTYLRNRDSSTLLEYGDKAAGTQSGYLSWCGSICGPHTEDGFYTEIIRPGGWAEATKQPKYFGMMFGMGGMYQWPAARLGGVAPPQPQQRVVSVNTELAPEAAQVRVIVTSPNSAKRTFTCSAASSCTVEIDRRQGDHRFEVEYLSSTGAVIARSEPEWLKVE